MNDDNKARLIMSDIHHKVELVERIRVNHPGTPAIFSATTSTISMTFRQR